MTPPAVLHRDISGGGAKRTFDLFVSLSHNLVNVYVTTLSQMMHRH